MTIEERMGQFLFIGVPGTAVDGETRKLLDEIQPGGVVLFDRNLESPRQVAELNAEIRSRSKILPLVSIDEEGGRVDRLKKIGTPLPSAKDLRTSDDAG